MAEETRSERRGVLASYGIVTPTPGRRTDDISKFKMVLRDALFLAIGAASMWGTQVATQSRTQAAVEHLGEEIRGMRDDLQRQIDEVRKTANLGVVDGTAAQVEAARLQGIMLGAGIKGVR